MYLNSTVATSLAASAALIAIATASTPASATSRGDNKTVACYGINSCKGQSDCKTAHNECKGMNSCKGQGFQHLTLKECKAGGGSLEAK